MLAKHRKYFWGITSVSDYYPFSSKMYGRRWNVGYRFGFNGKENDNEIYGVGNAYDFGDRMYDARLGRWWSVDPVTKPWESPYSTLSNNPIWFNDVLGLDVINAHKVEKERAESKLNLAKEKFAKLKKGDEGYREAKKALRKTQREFNYINEKFQRIESKINEIKEKDPDLYNKANNLLDPGGTEIDIYVYDTPHDIMQVGVKEGMVRFGFTDAEPGNNVQSYDNSFAEYMSVKSKQHGDNTITIRISELAKTIHLAHEFGHAIYMGQNMKEYVEWLKNNPKEQNKKGHGIGDPSGKAASEAEKKLDKII